MNKVFFYGIGIFLGGVLLIGCGSSTVNTTPQKQAEQTNPTAQHDHEHSMHESEVMHAHVTRLQFSSVPAALQAGKAADWTLLISDVENEKPIPKFEVMHDKLLHLIVVSKDLSWFTHIHPQWQGEGKFTINYALLRAGDYWLYADYVTPEGGHEVATHALKVGGANPLPAGPKLVADKLVGPWITKKFQSHDEGKAPSANAATYEVALMPMPATLRAGQEAMLHFQVRDANGKPLSDLQPYMGAMGHAVILSADGQTYLHTHPMEGDEAEMKSGGHDHSKMNHAASPNADGKGGPDVMFHTMFPKAGKYRAWGQFMHNGKVITSAYTLEVLPAPDGA